MKNTKSETEIETKQATEVAISTAPRRGFEEDAEQEDLIIPRAKLLQALSPEVEEDPKRFQAGMIINSLTKETFPLDNDGRIVFVPILKKTNWIRFNPRDKKSADFDPAFETGAIIWRSTDLLDPRVQEDGKFGANGEPPKATKFLNFLAHIPGTFIPVLISFSKTSFKAGKELLSLTQFSQERDMFAWTYTLRSKKETGDNGAYFVLKIDKAAKTSADDFKVAEALWERFHAKELTSDEAGISEGDKPGTARPY